METQKLRYRGIAKEFATTALTVYLLCKILGLILRIFFSTALIMDKTNEETVFRPLKPFGEYTYYRQLRRNSRSKIHSGKTKTMLVEGNKRAMHRTSGRIRYL